MTTAFDLDALGEEWSTGDTDPWAALKSVDVPRSSDEVNFLKSRHELDKLAQANALREKFYAFGTGIVSVGLLFTLVVSGVLLWQGRFSENVAIAFFIHITAQLIGIMIIIAKYLFPDGGH